MRNLKKFLALVLAMAMAFSLMLTANASNVKKTYTDSEQITKEFTEAVDVLTGLGVFQGDENGFRPGDTITRAEVATIIYRIATGDVDGNQVNIYADYGNFVDVAPTDWFAGAVGYCANAEYIKGHDGYFNPYDSVTGYEALAMILRAVGYDRNHEFEGAAWQTRVASLARELGVTENVKNANFETTLSMAARRDVVADLLFQAAAYVPTVTWSAALGYNSKDQVVGGNDNPTLGEKTFDLNYSAYKTVDDWGRPGYYWFKDTKHDGVDVASGSGKNIVATIIPEPEKTYTTAIRECDLSHDLDISTSATFDLYVNDKDVVTTNYLVVATDTVTKVGGQGRLTEVYRDMKNDKGGVADRVVMIDTFLAQVTGVSNAVLDAAGHVIVPAKLTLSIYDQVQTTAKTPNPSVNRVISKGSSDATNWEYSKGDMILLNAYTDHDGTQDSATAKDLHTGANAEKAAFETEQVELKDSKPLKETTNPNTQETAVNKAEVLGLAKYQVAKQTVVYWNQEKHNVGGTDYPDQLDLFLDVAGTTVNSDFTWYFDQYGNIIGIGDAVKSNYGVITSLYSSFSTTEGATDGKAVAKAHVMYSDGTEADIVIDRFLASTDGTITAGHGTAGNAMQATDGSVELIPVYDYNYQATGGSGNVTTMTMTGVVPATGYTKPSNVEVGGHLYVSPVASINKDVEGNGNSSPFFGIIEDNLFKFVTAGDGKVTAIEVAGKWDKTTLTNENDDVYVYNYNDKTNAAVELKKNAGFLAVTGSTIRLDNNTDIVLMENKTIKTYAGLSDLPGDVAIASGTEVDWADYDNDGIADVVYTKGTVKGTITYGLFYYNGGAAQWTGGDKTGTIQGYLNGVPTTLTFDDQNEFNHVLNSMSAPVYAGHLFAVQLTNDVVTNLMGDESASSDPKEQFLQTVNTPVTIDDLDLNTATAVGNFTWGSSAGEFVCGVTGGNDYTGTTKAVWFHDDNAAAATTATYNANSGTVTLNSTVYYLTGASKTLGNDLSYLNRADYTNDITIVYDVVGSMNTITEIYVTTLPDITPGGTGVTFGSDIQKAPDALTTDAGLKAWLKGFSSGVYYSDQTTTGTTAATKATMLYFPFVSPTNSGSAVLEIRNASGTLVYSEANNLTTAGALLYSFDFANATGSWMISPNGLTAGTYSYNITVNNASVSSGTFTLITK